MTVTQVTRERLASIGPTPVAGYLRNHGWTLEAAIEDKADIWRRDDSKVVRPIRQDLGDYALRLADLLAALEHLEQRSRDTILQDLSLTSSDVLRFRFSGPDLESGQLPLIRSGEIFDRTKELLSAAASAAVAPKSVYGPRRPDEAVDWVGKLRLAPETGSVVLKVISDTTAALDPQGSLVLAEEPFERRAVVSVMRAVREAGAAAAQAAGTGTLAPFERSVRKGVSANLCEALASLLDATRAHTLNLSVSWTTTRAAPPGVPDHVILSADAAPLLRGAGQALRSREPMEDYLLEGFVVKLHREVNDPLGSVTIHGLVDDSWRKVQTLLGGAAYETAIRAHGENLLVHCTGTLLKRGRGFEFENPHDFLVVEEVLEEGDGAE